MRLTTALACSLFAGLSKHGRALPNPAATNCVDQNFTSQLMYAPDGGQYGLCIFGFGFSNFTACEEWAFKNDECNTTNPNFGIYCADSGGEVSQENVDWGDTQGAPPATYEVCTSNGEQCTDYDYYANNNCSFAPAVIGMPGPASTVCLEKGGTDEILYQADGGEYSVCVFNDDSACESWALEQGDCAEGTTPVFSTFCADSGGEIVEDKVNWGEVQGAPPATYQVCTVKGIQCAANYYYTTGCADLNSTNATEIGEAISAQKVPKGESAQIDCQSGGYCCSSEGNFERVDDTGSVSRVEDDSCPDGVAYDSGVIKNCVSEECVVTCTGACDVTVTGGAIETPATTVATPAPPVSTPAQAPVVGPTPAQAPAGVPGAAGEPSGSSSLCHGVMVSLVVISIQICSVFV